MRFLRLLAQALSMAGVRGVGVILVDEQGRFLLNLRGRRSDKPGIAQRPARSVLSRRWAILGGLIDRGETAEQAARREVREEIGHEAPRLHLVTRVRWPRQVYLFAAGLPVREEQIQTGEGVAHRLVSLDEVRRLPSRAPLLHAVLRAFAGTDVYRCCREDARRR